MKKNSWTVGYPVSSISTDRTDFKMLINPSICLGLVQAVDNEDVQKRRDLRVQSPHARARHAQGIRFIF